MLSEKRIEEADNNVKKYLREKQILKRKCNPSIISILKENASQSLILAKELYDNNKSDLWTIVISYYAMFYIASAVIRKNDWHCSDRQVHKITADMIIVLFREQVKKTLIESYESGMDEALLTIKTDEIISSLDNERKKRGQIQYEMTSEIKHSRAKTSLTRAQNFYLEMLKLLNKF